MMKLFLHSLNQVEIFFKKYGKTYKVVAESYNRVVKRNPERFLLINDIQDVVGRGEAGEFIEHRRNALPSLWNYK